MASSPLLDILADPPVPCHHAVTPTINTTMRPAEWAKLLLLGTIFGSSYFFIAIALEGLPPVTLVTIRVGLAAFVLWAFVAFQGRPLPRSPRIWTAFIIIGLLNNVFPFSLIVWGQTQIPSALTAILNATTPLFAVFTAGLFLADERATLAKVVGVFVGFGGVVLMIGPDLQDGWSRPLLAQFAVLAASASYSLAGVYGRRFRRDGLVPAVIAAGQLTASTLLLLPVALVADQPFALPLPGWDVWAAAAALGLLGTVVAYLLYFQLLASAGATNVLLVTFINPVVAILLGVLILGERLGWVHAVGIGLIAFGLTLIDGRLWRRLRRRKPEPQVEAAE